MMKSYINRKTCIGAVVFGATAGLLAMSSLAPAQPLEAGSKDEVYSATAVASLPSGTNIISFDISYVDPTLGLYVLGDRTNKAVDVVNTTSLTGTLLAATPPFAGATGNNNTSGPDGVLIVPKANNGDGTNEVWAGDGPSTNPMTKCSLTATSTVPQPAPRDANCSTVKVIDLSAPHATLHVIPTGGMNRADEMCLDTADNLLMVANNADNPVFGSIISTKDYTVKSQISFPFSTNGAEQCQWSPRTGLFYITIPGVNTPDDGTGEVLAIDPKSGTIVKTFPIPLKDCSTPQGLAVGPTPQIMVGCNGAHAVGPGIPPAGDSGNGLHSGVIINENSGSVIGVIPNESGPDEVYYNAGSAEYFLARSAAVGDFQFLGVVDATGKRADSSVTTANKTIAGRNAHSVAADSGTNKVFVPIPAGTGLVCTGAGGSDANGCIAVFTTTGPADKGKPIVRSGADD
jgi:hypothetical protein